MQISTAHWKEKSQIRSLTSVVSSLFIFLLLFVPLLSVCLWQVQHMNMVTPWILETLFYLHVFLQISDTVFFLLITSLLCLKFLSLVSLLNHVCLHAVFVQWIREQLMTFVLLIIMFLFHLIWIMQTHFINYVLTSYSMCTSILDYIVPLKVKGTKPKLCPLDVFVDKQSTSGRRTS